MDNEEAGSRFTVYQMPTNRETKGESYLYFYRVIQIAPDLNGDVKTDKRANPLWMDRYEPLNYQA